jgi:hypothetical protein
MKAKFVKEGEVSDLLKPKSPKEIKKSIDEITSQFEFKVRDLKKLLENIDDDLPVGTNGHFGEFHPMNDYNFHISTSHPVPAHKGWRNMLRIDMPIFQIRSPNIGEPPE